jgi:hypothetical protein
MDRSAWSIARFLVTVPILFVTRITLILTAPPVLDAAEVLYNGIVLPETWPPKVQWEDIKARKPIAEPPYLVHPSAVIPINVGRQLFVDGLLVAQTTLKRAYHPAACHSANPVFTGPVDTVGLRQ